MIALRRLSIWILHRATITVPALRRKESWAIFHFISQCTKYHKIVFTAIVTGPLYYAGLLSAKQISDYIFPRPMCIDFNV